MSGRCRLFSSIRLNKNRPRSKRDLCLLAF
jgi:hypothetical protein